jgi:hypothetical protein
MTASTSSSRRIVWAFALFLCATTAALALSSPARATKITSNVVGTTGTGTTGGAFNTPRDVAVNDPSVVDGNAAANGDFYVADDVNHRVQRFDADGTFDRAWGRDVIQAGAPGDLGDAFEICVVAANCKAGSFGTAADGPAGEFDNPQGIAVDQDTGNVYVSDRDNRRIQQFDANGNFVRMFGFDVIAAAGPPPNSNGTGYEICDVTNGNAIADCKLGLAGTGVGQYGSGTTANGYRLDVSPSDGNPATGEVFLANTGNRRVERYGLAGASPGNFGTAADFGTSQPLSVAAGATTVFASDSSNLNEVDRYDLTGGAFLSAISVSSLTPATSCASPPCSAAAAGLEVDPLTGNLFVGRASTLTGVLEIGTPSGTPTLVEQHRVNASTGSAISVTPAGIGFNSPTGELFIASTSGGHRVYALDDDGAAPATVVIGPASDVEATTATLHATINSNGPLPTEYDLQISLDGGSWTTVASGESPSGNVPVAVDAPITGLQANSTYRVRVVTRKGYGNPSAFSSELTFVTDKVPPTAVTLPAQRRATSLVLQGNINPNNQATTYRFEYGQTDAYGSTVPVPDGSVGSSNVESLVQQELTSLRPDTTYHFRVVATNPEGTVFGDDQVATTRSLSVDQGADSCPNAVLRVGASADLPDCRAYELATPRDKVGGSHGEHGNNSLLDGENGLIASFPSTAGHRLMTSSSYGPVYIPGAAVFVSDSVLGENGDRAPGEAMSEGWRSHSAFTRRNYGNPAAPFLDPSGTSDDLSLSWYVNHGGTAHLFPEMLSEGFGRSSNYNSTYLTDWSGRWDLVAPTDPAQGANPGGFGNQAAVAGDGSAFVLTTDIQGLLRDSGDPTNDLAAGADVAAYFDVGDGLSDSYAGRGPTELLGVCTPGTEVPARVEDLPGNPGAFVQGSRPCPGPVEFAPGEFRDGALISTGGATTFNRTNTDSSTLGIVSNDGSRAFFLSPDDAHSPPSCAGVGESTACPTQLYVRAEGADGNPVARWISKSTVPGQAASLMAPVYFDRATPDGDKVFFHTNAPLTADDPNGACGAPCTTGAPAANSWDVFMYDFPDAANADPGQGVLTRVSRGPDASADANVAVAQQNQSIPTRFISTDGKRVYFTTAAPIPEAVVPASGASSGPGGATADSSAVNLYLYDATESDPEWTFVARLPRSAPLSETIEACATTAVANRDGRYTEARTFGGSTRQEYRVETANCVRGTDSGSFATFWTTGQLTADDPDQASGDMYGFDVDSEELVRISATQGGAGGSYTCVTATDTQCHGDNGFVSGVARRFNEAKLGVATRPRSPGDKIAFFESKSQLVDADRDDNMDVYQWRNGELTLLSVGIEDTHAHYSGNSVDGDDVFVRTSAQLSWQDIDGVRDTYDMSVGGGVPEPQTAICAVLGGACHVGGATPISSTPANGASGGGNAKAVRRQIALAMPTAKARRRAARTGMLPIRLRGNVEGGVAIVARARVRGKNRIVARQALRGLTGGTRTVKIKLTKQAMREIGRHGRLRVRVRASSRGARPAAVVMVLRRSRR